MSGKQSHLVYSSPKNQPVSDNDLIDDMKEVSNSLKRDILTQKNYDEHGKYNSSTIVRRFGTWNKAIIKCDLSPANIVNYSDKELYENILNIWKNKGEQPVRKDLESPASKIRQTAYNRRFGSWGNAIKCFCEYAGQNNIELTSSDIGKIVEKYKHTTPRFPNARLKLKILNRDNHKCVYCGRSPAEDGVKLEIDHIKSWESGGETTLDNLQTLCNICNGGKSNLNL
jgi:hypothetical protein